MRTKTLLFSGILLTGVFTLIKCSEPDNPGQTTGDDFHFNENMITPGIPGDVDTVLYRSLNPAASLQPENWANLAKLKRMFNIFSWQSLLAINWPVGADGKPMPEFSDAGDPSWLSWKEYYEVFRCNGEAPTAWGAPRVLPCAEGELFSSLSAKSITDRHTRVLFLDNKNMNVANEDVQAFAAPLKDQNGNLVRYEILMNEEEYNYVVKNELYNLEGQVVFSTQTTPGTITPADFPSGIFGSEQKGAIEIKLAWRILDDTKGDDASRYFTMDSWMLAADGKTWKQEKIGLVGFHISQKPTSSKQWVWSTFEHVDNLNTATLDAALSGGNPIQPTFYNYYNPTAPTDIALYEGSEHNSTTLKITQCERRIPIPPDVAALNAEVRAILKSMGSVWQYYELIDTQWPTDPSVPPTPGGPGTAPGSVANKTGGLPTPAFLTNITMESYFQNGNQIASNLEETNLTDSTLVFGTESCMGCHSSAGICIAILTDSKGQDSIVFAPQLSGDFSWLLSQKAKRKKTQ